MCRSQFIILQAAFWLISLPFAHAQNLQPESQQEFRRTYGYTGGSEAAPESSDGTLPTNPGLRANLQPESAREFSRVFGQNVLSGTVDLQSMATPDTINSTILTTLTGSADKRRFYALWHLVAVDLTAIDHRANLTADPTTFHEQLGPARTARALALIHQAMFEAANAIDRTFVSTLPGLDLTTPAGTSQDAAIVEAAFQTISWLYPGLKDQPIRKASNDVACGTSKFSLATYYVCSLDAIAGTAQQKNDGVALGRRIAGRIIADRGHDGAERAEPLWDKDFVPRQGHGQADYPFVQWQRDPVSQLATALGGYWGEVKPFALSSGFEFRPPESGSPATKVQVLPIVGTKKDFAALASYNFVLNWSRETRLDSSGKVTMPPPAGDAFFLAQFWAYDGTANLCAPARLYNQIAAAVLYHLENQPADGRPSTLNTNAITDVARYYALINMAMADASIAAWDAKYHFQFPRPVTYIRAVAELAAPKGVITTKWFPIGAQNTNSDQTFNITPPFPSYPSGHAVFGGALVGVLRQFAKDTVTFNFKSDEFNGKNKDVFNYIRCSDIDAYTPKGSKFCNTRTLNLNCTERENADSRVFMGVHWVFDADDGIVMGNRIASVVYRTLMKPLSGTTPSDPPATLFSRGRHGQVCDLTTPPTGEQNQKKRTFDVLPKPDNLIRYRQLDGQGSVSFCEPAVTLPTDIPAWTV